MKEKLLKVYRFVKNKYLLVSVGTLVWLAFFDRNDLVSQYQLRQQLNKLKQDKEYFSNEIKKNQQDIHELKTNEKNLEKFAREKYLMKKENEDIFVIVKE